MMAIKSHSQNVDKDQENSQRCDGCTRRRSVFNEFPFLAGTNHFVVAYDGHAVCVPDGVLLPVFILPYSASSCHHLIKYKLMIFSMQTKLIQNVIEHWY